MTSSIGCGVLCCLALLAVPTSAEDPELTSLSRWTEANAILDAATAIKRGDIFIYATGGFVCTPAVEAEDMDFALTLRQEVLTCGCELTPLRVVQIRYAMVYNNRILEYLRGRPWWHLK